MPDSTRPGLRAMRTSAVAIAVTAVVALAACRSGGASTSNGTVPPPAPETATDGSARPRDAQGASGVTTVEGSDIRQVGPQRIEEYLNGRVPGLQVLRDESGRYSLRIRGAASFGHGDEEPLVVIDGIPTPQGMNGEALRNIDPRDIARIEVLKDASQTAMYGSRGANGVLVIRTRKQ
jgi:TonB-dependent SusC/RagA subfamily outer membrane receptor